MNPPVTAALNYLPPSLNRTQHANWTRVRAAKRQLQHDLELALLASGLPRPVPGAYIEATALLLVPDRRRCDEGNFRTPLEKALGDALTNGDWLPDDTPEHYSFGALTFEHVRGVRATRVTLTWPESPATPCGRRSPFGPDFTRTGSTPACCQEVASAFETADVNGDRDRTASLGRKGAVSSLVVAGLPAPKGLRTVGRRRDGSVFTRPASRAEHPWVATVAQAAMVERARCGTLPPPYRVELAFVMPFALRPAHAWPTRADLDKLTRAVLDARVQGGLLLDDRHVTELVCSKSRAAKLGGEGGRRARTSTGRSDVTSHEPCPAP